MCFEIVNLPQVDFPEVPVFVVLMRKNVDDLGSIGAKSGTAPG